MNNVRKITGFILVGIIVIFTILALLGIWEVIDLEDIAKKAFQSLLVVFVASAVVLFITTVLVKDDQLPPKDKTE